MPTQLENLREILLDDTKVWRADVGAVDFNDSKRIDAATKLGEIKTEGNIAWLVSKYRDDREGDFVCQYIAHALLTMNTPNSREALQEIVDSNNPWRYYAGIALGIEECY